MLPAEHARGEALLTLARERFDPALRPIEEQVLRHSCAYEDPADWTPDPDVPDPTRHETTGRPLPNCDLPAIRPTLLRWLLTDPDATALLEPRGLRVWNARLTDPLDLIGCTVPARLELRYCLVEAPILLANASLPTLSLRNCTLERTLDAPFLKLNGPLTLDDITAAASLNFNGATVHGEVRLTDATLNGTGTALSLQGAVIDNDLLLRPKLRCSGALEMEGLRLGGLAGLSGAGLTTTLTAINLDRASVHGNVELDKGFACAGKITMIGAVIQGQLMCNGATLTATGTCLILDGAKVDVGVFLVEGFSSSGTIQMNGAILGATFDCSGATFTATGDALTVTGAKVYGSAFFSQKFTSSGTIDLGGTEITGGLDFKEATLTSPGNAVLLSGTKVGHVRFSPDFRSDGTLYLPFLKVGGQLDCDGAFIRALVGESMEIGGDLLWRQIKNPEQTSLDLRGAKIRSVYDDYASWPTKGNLQLDGLHINDLSPLHAHHLDITGRIAWLNRQPDYQLAEPQPWLHLASHFEAKGHKRAAKRVIYELRRHQSRANWKNSRFKHLGYAWDTRFARLEQQPFFILIPILLLASISGSVFSLNKRHFAESSESAYKATHTPNPQAAPSYPKFQPFVYALENVLPVIKLGQDDKWAPDPAHTGIGLYRGLVWLRWFLILSGWVMGGILAAAVSARFRA